MSDYITICEQAARAGGQVLRDWQGRIQVREKGPKDLVTEADLASQAAIREIVLSAFPDHGFLGEEDASAAASVPADAADAAAPAFEWVVDPLDGTTNYVHQLPNYSVSVALRQGDRLLVGAVYDPVMDECFTAVAGRGAFLNGKRIHTSTCRSLDHALVAASFSANVKAGSAEVTRFTEVLYRCQALRRLGSAALNLSYVAAGRLDAYWATSVNIWDIAAGMLLVSEAGGVVTALDGLPLNMRRPRFVASANVDLHAELRDVLLCVDPNAD